MKKIVKNILLVLVFAVTLPLVSLLTACGATPSGEITGIKFDAMSYQDGVSVFEVDKDVETSLTYKIYPSSASGYKVYFDPIDKGTAENAARFTFQDGKITVNSNEFESVRYKVRVGEFTDTCIIKLKEYPVKIYTDTPTVTLSTFDVFPINVKAEFIKPNGTKEIRNIYENDYDFVVESTNETIINIPNENRLKICAVRNGSASANVKVTLKNGLGLDLSFEIKVNVIQNISEAFVAVSGYNEFVYSGDTVNLDAVKFDINPINDGNYLITEEKTYEIKLSDNTNAKLSDDGTYVLINGAVSDGYKLKVTIICSDSKLSDNSTFAIVLNFIIKR